MKHLLVVLTEPVEGREEEYNDYYEHLHLDEVLATTPLVSAQRFRLTDEQGLKCPLPYLAIYEVEADDPTSLLPALNATRPQRVQSDALNRRTAGAWVFSEIGPKHTRKD